MSFEEKLKELLSVNTFDVHDRSCFYEIVCELRNINRLYANLMLIAYEAAIFDDIFDEIEIDQDFYNEHVKKVREEFGMSDDNSEWMVDTCCRIYGEKILMIDCNYQSLPKETSSRQDVKAVPKHDAPKRNGKGSVKISDLKKGEKLPKAMVHRVAEAESEYNIDDMTLTVTNDGGFGDTGCIKVVGEITSDELSQDIIIFVMIYNADNELIGTSFDQRIDMDDFNGFDSFSCSVYLPRDEKISKVIVRPVQNPVSVY